MMLRHGNVPAPSSHKILSQFKLTQHLRRSSSLAVVLVLILVTLACAFIGPSSRSDSDRIARLPTLTPTPLPTLTPTAMATPSAEAGVTSSTLVPTSTVISSSQTTPLPAEPVLTSPPPVPPPAVPPANSDTSASPATANPGSSGPLLTAQVGLNVRAGPGLDYAIVGQLVQGQSVQISGKNPEGTWWQIVYPPGSGSPAWVSAEAQYATASGVEAVQLAQLPPPPPPTATPTPAPVAPSIQTPPASTPPAAQPIQTPGPTGAPTAGPTATPISESPGWAFVGVRVYPDQYQDGLLLYGNLINNTGSTQELGSITGTFYDGQGQVIADEDKTYSYWPAYTVPPGGDVPFELAVDEIDSAADFKLKAEAQPSDDTPRQDFEFSDVEQKNKEAAYCVQGKVQNSGGALEDYLVIAVVLYDDQNNVINFGDYSEFGTGTGEDDENVKFEICVDPLNQAVARYELRAWGR